MARNTYAKLREKTGLMVAINRSQVVYIRLVADRLVDITLVTGHAVQAELSIDDAVDALQDEPRVTRSAS
jgi:hypothetical protein